MMSNLELGRVHRFSTNQNPQIMASANNGIGYALFDRALFKILVHLDYVRLHAFQVKVFMYMSRFTVLF